MNRIDNLTSKGTAYRIAGITQCITEKKRVTNSEINAIKMLKKDERSLFGRPVSYFAIAALDLLRIEKYKGEEKDIYDLIKGFKGI